MCVKGEYGHIECETHFLVFSPSPSTDLADPLMAGIHQTGLLYMSDNGQLWSQYGHNTAIVSTKKEGDSSLWWCDGD